MNIKQLIGKTLTSVQNIENERIVFTTDCGEVYELYHEQDCCEEVRVEDVNGDFEDLTNSEITFADESCNSDQDCITWTFYRIATIKGFVTIRWYGESNGYYSEKVSFRIVK